MTLDDWRKLLTPDSDDTDFSAFADWGEEEGWPLAGAVRAWLGEGVTARRGPNVSRNWADAGRDFHGHNPLTYPFCWLILPSGRGKSESRDTLEPRVGGFLASGRRAEFTGWVGYTNYLDALTDYWRARAGAEKREAPC